MNDVKSNVVEVLDSELKVSREAGLEFRGSASRDSENGVSLSGELTGRLNRAILPLDKMKDGAEVLEDSHACGCRFL